MKQNLYPINNLQSLDEQPCVRAIRRAEIPFRLRVEAEAFIQRNLLPDCWRVPPNDLKAHIVKTAKKIGLRRRIINRLKRLFKSKVGYKGFYLDDGELKRA